MQVCKRSSCRPGGIEHETNKFVVTQAVNTGHDNHGYVPFHFFSFAMKQDIANPWNLRQMNIFNLNFSFINQSRFLSHSDISCITMHYNITRIP